MGQRTSSPAAIPNWSKWSRRSGAGFAKNEAACETLRHCLQMRNALHPPDRPPTRTADGEVFNKVLRAQCHKIYGERTGSRALTSPSTASAVHSINCSRTYSTRASWSGAVGQARTITTTGGRVKSPDSSLKSATSGSSSMCREASRKSSPAAEIDEMKTSELSLMPEDLEKDFETSGDRGSVRRDITLDKPPSDPCSRANWRESARSKARDVTNPAQLMALLGEVAPGFSTAAVEFVAASDCSKSILVDRGSFAHTRSKREYRVRLHSDRRPARRKNDVTAGFRYSRPAWGLAVDRQSQRSETVRQA